MVYLLYDTLILLLYNHLFFSPFPWRANVAGMLRKQPEVCEVTLVRDQKGRRGFPAFMETKGTRHDSSCVAFCINFLPRATEKLVKMWKFALVVFLGSIFWGYTHRKFNMFQKWWVWKARRAYLPCNCAFPSPIEMAWNGSKLWNGHRHPHTVDGEPLQTGCLVVCKEGREVACELCWWDESFGWILSQLYIYIQYIDYPPRNQHVPIKSLESMIFRLSSLGGICDCSLELFIF